MGFCINQQTVSASPEMHGPDSPTPTKTLTRRFSRPLKNAYRAPRLQQRGLRSYSPSVGKWLSRDPIGERGGLNLFASVKNEPVGAIDPIGLKVRRNPKCQDACKTEEDCFECMVFCEGEGGCEVAVYHIMKNRQSAGGGIQE